MMDADGYARALAARPDALHAVASLGEITLRQPVYSTGAQNAQRAAASTLSDLRRTATMRLAISETTATGTLFPTCL